MSSSGKKYTIPLIASGIFILGLVCLVIPFLPFGWLFIAMTALIIAPYFKFMREFLGKIIKKDKTGIFKKAGKKVAELYLWAGDKERAKEMKEFIDEANAKKK